MKKPTFRLTYLITWINDVSKTKTLKTILRFFILFVATFKYLAWSLQNFKFFMQHSTLQQTETLSINHTVPPGNFTGFSRGSSQQHCILIKETICCVSFVARKIKIASDTWRPCFCVTYISADKMQMRGASATRASRRCTTDVGILWSRYAITMERHLPTWK